jgi:hypothetical protein
MLIMDSSHLGSALYETKLELWISGDKTLDTPIVLAYWTNIGCLESL